MAERYLSAPRKSIYIIEDVAARLQAIKDEHQPKEIILDKKAWIAVPSGVALVVVAALNIYIDHDGHIRTNCRVDDKITFHLAAGGIFVITAVFAKAIIKLLCLRFRPEEFSAEEHNDHPCNATPFSLVDVLNLVVFTAWIGIGFVWMFEVHNKVTHVNPMDESYCPLILYKSTQIFLVLGVIWISLRLMCGLLCNIFGWIGRLFTCCC